MKKIIIGIDVSKEKCDATAIFVGKGLLEVAKLDYFVFENCPKGFRKLTNGWMYETCQARCSNHILRKLHCIL